MAQLSIENQQTALEEKAGPSWNRKAQTSTPKPHGKNIYLSSRIDGAIEVLKKSKQKEEELKKKKNQRQEPELTPDPAKQRLQAIYDVEKKYQDALKARHMQLQQSFEEKSELALGKHEKLSPRANSQAPKEIQSSQDYKDADIRLTHFGFVKDQDEFLSTRCRAFNYNKHSHMKMAYTFGTRRSTNMTSPQPRSIGLSTSANNWANSSTAMKIND